MAESKIEVPMAVEMKFEEIANLDYLDDWYKMFGLYQAQEAY